MKAGGWRERAALGKRGYKPANTQSKLLPEGLTKQRTSLGNVQ